MADTSCSKLFKPLPLYQLHIINELQIPIKNKPPKIIELYKDSFI